MKSATCLQASALISRLGFAFQNIMVGFDPGIGLTSFPLGLQVRRGCEPPDSDERCFAQACQTSRQERETPDSVSNIISITVIIIMVYFSSRNAIAQQHCAIVPLILPVGESI